MATVTGNQATFTWSGGSMTLTATDQCLWRGDFGGTVRKDTPFGYVGERYGVYMVAARGEIEYVVNTTDGTAPIPSGTAGTLVLTSFAGHTYTFSALLVKLEHGGETMQALEQRARYQWLFSAQTSTDTITVA